MEGAALGSAHSTLKCSSSICETGLTPGYFEQEKMGGIARSGGVACIHERDGSIFAGEGLA